MYPNFPFPSMGNAGDPDFSRRPFAAGSLFGCRSWEMDNPRSLLRGLFYPQEWKAGVNQAICRKKPHLKVACWRNHEDDPKNHVDECWAATTCDGIDIRCSCGFWAYTNGRNDYYEGLIGQGGMAHVTGIVEAFGKCVVGPKGFRAGKAVIRALVLPAKIHPRQTPTPEQQSHVQRIVRESMARFYPGVPVFSTLAQAMAEYPLTATDEGKPDDKKSELET
jgi:hypothetical protein